MKMLNPLRTQVRAVRFGTPPDFEDGLVESRIRRLGSVILSYHQLVALLAQASQPVTAQPAQQAAQPEVRRALPVDTVEVRRAELVVPRAELVRLPGE
jgi:hypothetical protein